MSQKYKKGDQVRVVNIGSPLWESDGKGGVKVYDTKPEAIGHVGTIVGSYNDLFPPEPKIKRMVKELLPDRTWSEPKEYVDNTPPSPDKYEIEWPKGVNLYVAWWEEYQLEPADVNTPREEQQQYPSWKDSNMGKEMKKIAEDMENYIMWNKPYKTNRK